MANSLRFYRRRRRLASCCEFVSGVASLPRVVILTMHDISLRRASTKDIGGDDGRLILEGTVKTYRYIDEEEAAELAAAQVNQP